MELTGIRSAAELQPAKQAGNDFGELGRTQFLELMLAQMNNQDPLDPSKNEEFISQLAQFSELEGIENLNTTMANMADAVLSNVTLQASSLVGHAVIAPTNRTLMESGGFAGTVEVAETTNALSIEIKNQFGELIRQIDLGPQPTGELRFFWDGTNESGVPQDSGLYEVSAISQVAGQAVEQVINLPERVISVSLGEGGARANLAGGTDVLISQIKEIQ
jgi:flagellar basal-body rod modification protein FlgD